MSGSRLPLAFVAFVMRGSLQALALITLAAVACERGASPERPDGDSGAPATPTPGVTSAARVQGDSASRAFADTVIGRLLDTQVHELRGELFLR
jgi:hypothetical protein